MTQGATRQAVAETGAARRASPANLRGVMLVLALVSAFIVALLGVNFHGSHGPDSFDRPVSAAVQAAWPGPGAVAYFVDGIGERGPASVIIPLLVLGCLLKRWWRLAVVAAFGPLSAAAVAIMVKPFVLRTIHGSHLSFPSGHAAFATSLGMLLGLFLTGLFPRPSRVLGGTLLVGLGLVAGSVMAFDQIAIDAHYPTDTVGGFFTATAVFPLAVLVVDSMLDLLSRRARARTPRKRT